MEVLRVCAIGIVGVFLAIILSGEKKEYGILLGLVIGIIIINRMADYLAFILTQMHGLEEHLGNHRGYLSILLKAVGSTYICQFGCDVCADAGYKTVATQIEIFGKLYILVIGLPVITMLLETIQELGL